MCTCFYIKVLQQTVVSFANKQRINQILQTLTIQCIKPVETELICQTSGKMAVSSCVAVYHRITRLVPVPHAGPSVASLPAQSVSGCGTQRSSDMHFNKENSKG